MDQTGRITLRPCRYSRLAGAAATPVASENQQMTLSRQSDVWYYQPGGWVSEALSSLARMISG